jgi:hypothetical protein
MKAIKLILFGLTTLHHCTAQSSGGKLYDGESCIDSPDRFEVDILYDKKDCDWASKRNWRCKIPVVQQKCPRTCNVCKSDDEQSSNNTSSTPIEGNNQDNSLDDPFSWCQDSTEEFSTQSPKGEELKKTCTWAANKPGWRCEYIQMLTSTVPKRVKLVSV